MQDGYSCTLENTLLFNVALFVNKFYAVDELQEEGAIVGTFA